MTLKKLYIILLIPALSSCLVSPDMTKGIVNGKEIPTVVTAPTTRVAPVSSDGNLLFQGEITSVGKSEIIESGFYWSTTSNVPGENDSIIRSAANTDTFRFELQNVSGGKTYYWRAYAKNSFGCEYGETDSYTTPEIWIKENSLPPESRGNGAVFILNNSIYITCGIKSAAIVFANDTWEYNIPSNSWSQADSLSFLGAVRRYPVVFVIGNYAFVGTGSQTSSQAYKDFYQFDAGSKKWKEIPTPDDFEARYEATAFSLNGKGYVVCGFPATGTLALNDVWQYDADNNLWKKMNPFPSNFYGGISISNNVRSFTGFGEDSVSARTLWEYDAASDSWEKFVRLRDDITSTTTKKISSGVIIQNTIYIVDGDNNIWALNLSDTTWTKKSSLPLDFLNEKGETGKQLLLTTGASNSIYVGLGFSNYLYEYRPLWDN